MILTLLGISIFLVVLAVILDMVTDFDVDFLFVGGCVGTVVFIIWSAVLWYNIGTAPAIDKEIELYQQTNQQIEETIDLVVQEHMDFESETFKELKGKDSVDFITFYPELSSTELVQEQIKLYKENKNQIVRLEKKKINIEKKRWLLYFGG